MSLQISVVMPNMKVEINNQIMFFFWFLNRIPINKGNIKINGLLRI